MGRIKNIYITSFVRMLCALALMMSAYAHCANLSSINSIETSTKTIKIAALTLPDGTIASICISDENDEHHRTQSPCEFCRISATMALPNLVQSFDLIKPRLGNRIVPPSQVAILTTKFIIQHPTRAPPKSLI
jgi:hypothetical protein